MNRAAEYHSRLKTAKPAATFQIQGEAFTDYMCDNLTLAEYSDIYYKAESIMGSYMTAF